MGQVKMTDNPPEVYKVIGAPGTGKTTRVVGNPELEDHTSLVQQNLEDYSMEEQAIVTYTRAGVDEAKERLAQIYDGPKYHLESNVLTIHAHCFRALDVERDQVVNWWNKQNFCNAYDLEYGYGDDDDNDLMGSDADEGHQFFQIYEWVKNNMYSIEEWVRCPAEFESEQDFVELANKWEEWKSTGGQDNVNKLIEFHDMIEGVVALGQKRLHEEGLPNIFGDQPEDPMETFNQVRQLDRFDQEKWRGKNPWMDIKVLYVDEVQDLFPLQWAWYLMQKLVCEKVYIGGDDDQTIYGWAGADPSFMLDEEGDFEVLDKTYRIPSNIWETCDEVIQQVDKRQEKAVTPHGDGGDVITYTEPISSAYIKHIKEGECMALFRANYMVDEFREILHAKGIPYRNMSTFDTWSKEVVKVRDALAKMEKGDEKLTGDEVEALLENSDRECPRCGGQGCGSCDDGKQSMLDDGSNHSQKELALGNLGGINARRVRDMFDLSTQYSHADFTPGNFLDQTDDLNYYETQAIKGNLKKGRTDLEPDRLRIGTIHSAKGKEAETVFLALDSTSQILENMLEDTSDKPDKVYSDAERRVYYVGMTRASETLILAQGVINRDQTLHIQPLVGKTPEEIDTTIQEQEEQEEWAQPTNVTEESWIDADEDTALDPEEYR